VSQPEAQSRLSKVQLVALSALCLAGVGVLALRRWRAGQARRRWSALLVDSFALALLMLAFLFLSAVFGLASGQIEFESIRRVTFFVLGLAPLAFLVGMLDARLARSGVGDLIVGLQADPEPTDLRDSLARALRDPSLTLAYWLPKFATYADVEGRPIDLPRPDGRRAMTVIERAGAPVAALLHDKSLEDEPELLSSVTAAAGIALENTRLQVELPGGRQMLVCWCHCAMLSGRGRQRLERNLHDGAQQRLVALSLELSLLEGELGDSSDASRALIERGSRSRRR
jgi:signal transduction histidine kinase